MEDEYLVITKHLHNILYKVGPTSSTLVQHCINAIQMFCVYWVATLIGKKTAHMKSRQLLPTGFARQLIRIFNFLGLCRRTFQLPGYEIMAKAIFVFMFHSFF